MRHLKSFYCSLLCLSFLWGVGCQSSIIQAMTGAPPPPDGPVPQTPIRLPQRIFWAIKNNNVEQIKAIDTEKFLHIQYVGKRNVLHLAALYDRLELLKYFTQECGLILGDKDRFGFDEAGIAHLYGHQNLLPWLKKQHLDTSPKGELSMLLFCGIKWNSDMLFDKIPPQKIIDFRWKNSRSVLHFCALFGRVKLIKRFLSLSYPKNEERESSPSKHICRLTLGEGDATGYNELMIASIFGQKKMVVFLQGRKKDWEDTLEETENSLLHLCLLADQPEMCRFLIKKYKYNFLAVNKNRQNIMHIIARKGLSSVFDWPELTREATFYLFKQRDRWGKYPLHEAMIYGQKDLLKQAMLYFLLFSSDLFNKKDTRGYDGIMLVIEAGKMDMVKELLRLEIFYNNGLKSEKPVKLEEGGSYVEQPSETFFDRSSRATTELNKQSFTALDLLWKKIQVLEKIRREEGSDAAGERLYKSYIDTYNYMVDRGFEGKYNLLSQKPQILKIKEAPKRITSMLYKAWGSLKKLPGKKSTPKHMSSDPIDQEHKDQVDPTFDPKTYVA